jgi:hypothetical protein
MNISKSLIINLIGDTYNVYKVSIEIFNIVISENYKTKIIENYDLLDELNKYFKKDLLLNKCDNLTHTEIKKMNNFEKINTFYYNLFIIDNEIINKYKLNDIGNYYNIDNLLDKKEEVIKKILLSDYDKFNY